MTRDQFNDAYWASKHPDVRALREMSGAERESAAARLAISGHVIDAEIMALGWGDPYEQMRRREMYGYTWWPHMLMPPNIIAPGLFVPGIPPYDPLNPPPGAIKISLDLADYPRYPEPQENVPTQSGPDRSCPVGAQNIDTIYYAQPWDDTPHGDTWHGTHGTAGLGTWRKVFRRGGVGFVEYWEKIA